MIDVRMFRAAVDPSSLRVTKPVAAELKKIAKSRSFNNDSAGSGLIRASVLLAVFGDADRNALLAEALRTPDPSLSHTQGTRQRGAYATACLASSRTGSTPSIEERTRGWTVKPPLMEGLALRRYLDRSAEERQMDEFMPVSGHLDGYASDMAVLATMWLFGGSDEWPISRIEAEWDRNASAVRELPGYLDE